MNSLSVTSITSVRARCSPSFFVSTRLRALLSLVLFAPVAALLLQAAPFARKVLFTQPDGSRIELYAQGDDFHAVFETLDGFTVLFDPSQRAYFYARRAAAGAVLESSRVPVEADKSAPPGLQPHLRDKLETTRRQAQERASTWNKMLRIPERWQSLKAAQRATRRGQESLLAPPKFQTVGSATGLALLVDFSDEPATVPPSEIEAFCNGDGYSGNGNNGSVKEYYYDNSNGLLTYTNVVTFYVRLVRPKSFYNNTEQDSGPQANLLIKDALAILQNRPEYITEILPMFSSLTTDSQNWVLACNVFFAGNNSGVWSKGLWPHTWVLNDGLSYTPIDLGNGKQICAYQISDIGTHLELGTFCHETGHLLCGFPDLYDYDQDSRGGAGQFCIMNSGNFSSNPVQICAYLKSAAGWATITDLDRGSNLNARLVANPGEGFNHFYRWLKPGVPTEYYLVENRQKAGRDSFLPGSGIALWHVDELGDRDNQSVAPNPTHANYELTLVQADGLWDLEHNANAGDSRDLYREGNPAPDYSNRFADDSNPNAHWWDGAASGIFFHAFSPNASTMTFVVGSGDLAAPLLTAQPPVTLGTTNTISWAPGNGAVPNRAESAQTDSGTRAPKTASLSGAPDPRAPVLSDLQVTDSAASAGLVAGQTGWVRQRIYNPGPGLIGPSHAQLYLSTDNDGNPFNDFYVGETAVPALDAGEAHWAQWDFSMPDLGTGSYTVWSLCEVDSRNEWVESDENNLFKVGTGFSVAGAPLLYYAECSADASFTSPQASDWTAQTQWTFTNLVPGQTYWYRAKARQGIRSSGWSNVEFSQQSVFDQPPVLTAPSSVTVRKGAAQAVTGVQLSDPDSSSAEVTLRLAVGHGILTLATNVNDGLTADQVMGNGTATVTATAPIEAIHATLANAQGLVYTGKFNFVGTDTVAISVSESSINGPGTVQSAAATVAVTVSGSLYDSWLIHTFQESDWADPSRETTVWGATADPDHDGLPNLIEFALGLDPNAPEDREDAIRSGLITADGANHLTLTFKRRKNQPTLDYRMEVSSDSRVWTSEEAVVEMNSIPIDAEFDEVTLVDLTPVSPGAPRFARLVISLNTP